MREKALVTGGVGFIGSHLVNNLIMNGLEVAVIDNLSTGSIDNRNKFAVTYKADIRSELAKEIIKRECPDYIFHLAAQTSVKKSIEYPEENNDINLNGSLNILDSCKNLDVKKFIFASTAGVYEENLTPPLKESDSTNPSSPYAKSKLAIELLLQGHHRLNTINLRFANVYGPRQDSSGEGGVVAIFCDKISKEEKVIIHGNGNQTRDFIYVQDIVNAMIQSMNLLKGTYNVGTGEETNINDLFNKIQKVIKNKINPTYNPKAFTGQLRNSLDSTKIRSFGWYPKYSLKEGLKETYKYFESRSCH